MNVDGKENTTNVSTNSNFGDASMSEEDQTSLLLDQVPADSVNSYGNQPQNISRDMGRGRLGIHRSRWVDRRSGSKFHRRQFTNEQ